VNAILQALLATLFIAALMALRLVADRSALRARMRGGGSSECGDASCFRPCGAQAVVKEDEDDPGTRESNRSEDHAH
jgi:hypothetical protein